MGFEVDNAETKRINLSSHENSSFEVTGLVKHYPAGFVVPFHSHKRCHLLYSQQGVMAVEAGSGRWIVPPTTAVWLRPGWSISWSCRAISAFTGFLSMNSPPRGCRCATAFCRCHRCCGS